MTDTERSSFPLAGITIDGVFYKSDLFQKLEPGDYDPHDRTITLRMIVKSSVEFHYPTPGGVRCPIVAMTNPPQSCTFDEGHAGPHSYLLREERNGHG